MLKTRGVHGRHQAPRDSTKSIRTSSAYQRQTARSQRVAILCIFLWPLTLSTVEPGSQQCIVIPPCFLALELEFTLTTSSQA